MDSTTLRRRFLEFFQGQGHAVIGHAPLAPENDPSVLFTTAGMHPLVPYLLGEPHPAGRRLANVQPCLRTGDIDAVGDATHLTLFEMLGNWSLGDYWKERAIRLSYTLLTEVFGHDPARLSVTCFAGEAGVPRDEEAAEIWRGLGIPAERICFLPRADNWWGPAGATGPCGPDSEVFFDSDPGGPPGQTPGSHPARFWELANNVFMAYEKRADGAYAPLAQRNVDVGVGLERNLMALQGAESVYATDLFLPVVAAVEGLASRPQPFAVRVIADHVRAAAALLAEGVRPGNSDQPYIVRRLVRRAARHGRALGIGGPFLARLSEQVVEALAPAYPLLAAQRGPIAAALDEEEQQFLKTLARGERVFVQAVAGLEAEGRAELPGELAFRLYDTYGFPLELTAELAGERGLALDAAGFQTAQEEHQRRSRAGAAGRFAGGLNERNPATTRLHTATHLLQAALRAVLGPHVEQRGSNITAERLRFDFSHPERLCPEQIAAVEALVNRAIGRDLPVEWVEMGLGEARTAGVLGFFAERYGERVKVYRIGDVSAEICGGPHVARTGELGRFRILKEEAVGAGVRRIKAALVAEPA